MSEPTSPPPPVSTPTSEPLSTLVGGLAPNIAAAVACLFSLVGGVVLLVLEKKDQFVRFWAMQAVFLGAVGLAATVLTQMLIFIFRQIPFLGALLTLILAGIGLVFWLAWLVAYVITIVKAIGGVEWEIPVLGKLARRQLAHMDAGPPTPPSPVV